MSDEQTHTGGCLCGAIRYQAVGEPTLRSMCMCRSCQRWSGAAAGMGIQFRSDAIQFTRGSPKVYRSSAIFERSFCEACGSSVMTRYVVPPYGPDHAHVMLGTLDDPGAFAGPQFYFGIESHLHEWLAVDESLPQLNCDEDEGLARARANAEQGSSGS